MNEEEKDKELWIIAKKRAAFKASLLVYLFVNLFLVGVWYFTSGPGSYFWPIWPLLGWGIGMIAQYLSAYKSGSVFSAENEYQKLKNRNNKY